MTEFVTHRIIEGPHTIYLAVVAGEPVAVCRFTGDVFDFVYCDPAWRRQGITTSLRDRARIDIGPASGYPAVRTEAAQAWSEHLVDLDGNPVPAATTVLTSPAAVKQQEARGRHLLRMGRLHVRAGRSTVVS